jgi:hypothetical protein
MGTVSCNEGQARQDTEFAEAFDALLERKQIVETKSRRGLIGLTDGRRDVVNAFLERGEITEDLSQFLSARRFGAA